MLSSKYIRENLSAVEENLRRRRRPVNLQPFLGLEEKRLSCLREAEDLKAYRNKISKEIGQKKGEGTDTSAELAEMKSAGDSIRRLDETLSGLETEVNKFCLELPNMLAPDVPDGKDSESNIAFKSHGNPPDLSFAPLDHAALGEKTGIIDFERGVKLAGARFSLLYGKGAALERALINFMLAENTARGYTEVFPPIITNKESLTCTGQLPKFEEDLFKIEGFDQRFYLIPTAEVPVTNIHRDEILPESSLPLKYTAYTPCFRSEAGAAGRDTRGIIRQHQFNKVEIVKLCKPEDSEKEHELLLSDAENILKKLELPYRVMLLCSGDIGFAARKCYDIEVWLPSRGKYVEISSCSNFGDFQASRAGIRYKNTELKKNFFVHTLNGSALAVGRTLAAILENYQTKDGGIRMPSALAPFLGFNEIPPLR